MGFERLYSPLLLLSLLAVPVVQADDDPLVFMDVFGGYSWSEDQDVEISQPLGGVSSTTKIDDIDVYDGGAFGGRVGMWLKTRPSVGVAVDVTRFDTDIDNQIVTAMSPPLGAGAVIGTGDIGIANTFISFDLILRHRGERFSPYVLAGPGIMIANADDGGAFNGTKQEDSDTTFGYKAGAGISYRVSDTMHLFTEYRYIHSDLEFKVNSVDPLVVGSPAVNARIELDTDTHLVVGGLSIRF
jgi:opacity protein-like surface antigen